jgi:hypothetical protein
VIKPATPGIQFCDVSNPIYLSRHDELTPETKRQILAHDKTGETICGWGKYKASH